MTCAVTRKTGPKGGKTVCWPKESLDTLPTPPVLERDDIGKLPLSKGAKAYARRSGLAAIKRQPKEFQKVNATITNPGRRDHFQNYTVGQQTGGGSVNKMKHAIKEDAEQLVDQLLNGHETSEPNQQPIQGCS